LNIILPVKFKGDSLDIVEKYEFNFSKWNILFNDSLYTKYSEYNKESTLIIFNDNKMFISEIRLSELANYLDNNFNLKFIENNSQLSNLLFFNNKLGAYLNSQNNKLVITNFQGKGFQINLDSNFLHLVYSEEYSNNSYAWYLMIRNQIKRFSNLKPVFSTFELFSDSIINCYVEIPFLIDSKNSDSVFGKVPFVCKFNFLEKKFTEFHKINIINCKYDNYNLSNEYFTINKNLFTYAIDPKCKSDSFLLYINTKNKIYTIDYFENFNKPKYYNSIFKTNYMQLVGNNFVKAFIFGNELYDIFNNKTIPIPIDNSKFLKTFFSKDSLPNFEHCISIIDARKRKDNYEVLILNEDSNSSEKKYLQLDYLVLNVKGKIILSKNIQTNDDRLNFRLLPKFYNNSDKIYYLINNNNIIKFINL
jgi:hypothetical protein